MGDREGERITVSPEGLLSRSLGERERVPTDAAVAVAGERTRRAWPTSSPSTPRGSALEGAETGVRAGTSERERERKKVLASGSPGR